MEPNQAAGWCMTTHGLADTAIGGCEAHGPAALIRANVWSHPLVWGGVDAALVAVAVVTADAVADTGKSGAATPLTRLVLLAVCLQFTTGVALGLYRGRWEGGSSDEMSCLLSTATITLACLLATDAAHSHLGSDRLHVTATVLLLALTAGARLAASRWRDRRLRRMATGTHSVVVVGAGDGGGQVIRAMLRRPESAYRPVALIDDDPRKQNLRIMGIRVVGPTAAIPDAVRRFGADTVLMAVPSASARVVREISDLTAAAGATLRVLPPVSDLLDGAVDIHDIRPVCYEDLLGRGEVTSDIMPAASYLRGRCVLVTGAGGSIGSELCAQLAQQDIGRLVMLDRDESGLHGVQMLIEGRALLDSGNLVVADIRDRQRMFDVFSELRPDVVFHAAALKHLTLLEQHPGEAVKTNVFGTQNVLDAARAVDVTHLVNISTDKAADPTSVLGWSKRIAERLTAQAAANVGATFVSVRFGNVLGSRGSVIPAFQAQIAAGGPVTVTDPRATRFFMTVREAVRLVVQAAAIGAPGDVLVLDMGRPVTISDVARRLIDLSGRQVQIVFTGLRPGEKLCESLFGAGEKDYRPAHTLVSNVPVPPLPDRELQRLKAPMSRSETVDALRELATARPALVDVSGAAWPSRDATRTGTE